MTHENGPIPLLTEKDVAKHLSVSKALLRKWRRLNEGPVFKKIGRCIRYSPQDISEWLEAQSCKPDEAASQVAFPILATLFPRKN